MNPLDELIAVIWLGCLIGGIIGYVVATSGKLTFALLCATLGTFIGSLVFLVKKKYLE